MATVKPPIISARLDSAAELARLDALCFARGTTRSEVLRRALLGYLAGRGAVAGPASPVARGLAGPARGRFAALRRQRALARAEQAPSPEAVRKALAEALGASKGADPAELAEALDRLVAADGAPAALEVLRAVLGELGAV